MTTTSQSNVRAKARPTNGGAAAPRARAMTLDQLLALLRRMCDEEGSSQRDVAKRIGVHEATLSDVLNRRRDPGPSMLRGLGLRRVMMYLPIEG